MTAIHTSLRVDSNDLTEITNQAKHYKLSRSAFLVAAALKRLPDHQSSIEQRLDAIEDAIQRLERLTQLGGL